MGKHMQKAMLLGLSVLLSSQAFADQEVLREARRSDVVIVGEVIDVRSEQLFAFWSGLVPSIEHVRYKVIEVLKGELKSAEIDAGHFVVFNSRTADKKEPHLSPELFKPGNRILLSLSRENSNGCKTESAPSNIEAFCSPNENYGAVLANAKLVQAVRSSLGRD